MAYNDPEAAGNWITRGSSSQEGRHLDRPRNFQIRWGVRELPGNQAHLRQLNPL